MSTEKYRCGVCGKIYKTYKTLWNHNKLFHKEPTKEIETKEYHFTCRIKCDKCNKKFKHVSSKSRHMQYCNDNVSETILQLEKKIEKLEEIIMTKTTQIIRNDNKNVNNINVNTTNNYITYNFNSREDKEHVPYVLDDKSKLKIMMSPYYEYIPKLIETIYCGDFVQFKNVLVTNLDKKYMYIYQDGKFILENRDVILNTLLDNSYWNLESIVQDLSANDSIAEKMRKKIESGHTKFNKLYEDEETFYDHKSNTTYKNFKEYSKERILLLLFNNKDKIREKCALFSNKQLTEEEIVDMIEKKRMLELNACEN